MHVLEAVMVVSLVFVAISFTLTFDVPTHDNPQVRESMETVNHDILTILHERTPPDGSAESDLAYRIAREVQGEEDLTWYLERLLPQQEVNFHVSNGNGFYPVIHNGDPPGEAVSSSRAFTPGWESLYAAPDLDIHDGETPMYVSAYPVSWSHNIKLPGEGIIVEAEVLEAGGGGEVKPYVIHEQVSLPKWEEESVSIFAETSSPPNLDTGLYYTELQLQDTCNIDSFCEFTLVLNETANRTVDPDTRLSIHVPNGWTLYAPQPSNDDWGHTGWTGTTGPFELTSTLDTILRNDTSRFSFRVNPPATPVEPFSRFEVTLGNASSESRTEIVVPHDSVTTKAPRALYTSIPYPAPPNGTSTWGVAFSNGLDAVTVRSITLRTAYGAPMFEAAEPVSGANGTWTVSPDGTQMSWTPGGGTGDGELLSGEALDLLVDVDTTPSTTRFYPELDRATPTITFSNGYTHNLTRQREAPGVFTARIPSASAADSADGYTTGTGDHVATVRFHDAVRNANLTRAIQYTVNESLGTVNPDLLLDHQSALTASHLTATPHRVEPGETVTMRANLSSLLTTISDLGGTDVDLTTRLYAPPSIAEAPVVETNTTLEAAPRPRVTSLEHVDLTGDTVPDLALGSEDEHVYAVQVTETPLAFDVLWNKDLDAAVTHVVAGRTSLGATQLHAVADGTVTTLDALGSVRWSMTPTHGVNRILTVEDDDGGIGWDVVLVGSDGRWSRVTSAGSPEDTGALGTSVAAAAADDAGFVIGGAQGTIHRVLANGSLAWSATPDASAVEAVGSSNDTVLYALADGSRGALDATDGTTEWTRDAGGRLRQARVVPDVTGDGVQDLLAATAGKIVFVDGTGSRTWSTFLEGTTVPDPLECDLYEGGLDADAGRNLRELQDCDEGSSPATVTVHGSHKVRASPGDVRVGVVYEHGITGEQKLAHLAPDDGTIVAQRVLPAAAGVAAVTEGDERSWVGVGTDDGSVVLARAQGVMPHDRVTEKQSSFRFPLRVPLGAFYGGHLAVVDVTWDSSLGGERSARLHTSFDVVPAGWWDPRAKYVYDAHVTTWFDDW